ncbi:vomeronasal type-1 receptor 4-like [Microtus ochrogaster]|uniref:Vomeronasal type-1 receptor n=1 Tax=Microtus ochrogaster TaxID=79684 RepID=A0ABM0LSL4_MICOH|nr:vomeronasal type-1 receptor 4-like [Microtus ochrogaster]
MISRNLAMGIFFLSQTSLGFLGNLALLCCIIVSSFNRIRRRPTDLIVKHLTCANILVLLCKGIPQSMAAFGQTYPLGNISCKLVFYLHRVARGVSLGSTSLLSVFQAITISPSNSKWAQLKVRAPSIIGPSLGLCWALCLLANSLIIVRLTDMKNKENRTELRHFLYCLIVKVNKQTSTLYVILLAFNDIMSLGLMMWASGSMVLILLKHKQRVQHIHRSLSNKSLHETKATQRILILLSSFVVFYVASVILMMYFSVQDEGDTWVTYVNVAINACFPALCPFLLIGQYTRNFHPCST